MFKQKERDGEFCNFAVKDFHYLTSKTLLCKSSENELEVPQKWANLLSYMNDCDVVGWVDTMDWWSGLSASTVYHHKGAILSISKSVNSRPLVY